MNDPARLSRSVPLRKPRASSQARINAILAALRGELAEHGAGALSIYSVAERAQIPPSSVYHFFASVPALLEALTADVHAAFRAACSRRPRASAMLAARSGADGVACLHASPST